MPLPTVTRARVGVQAVTLYPWNDVTGPYDNTTACPIFALAELGLTKTSKSAILTGGESVQQLGAYEVDRQTKVKIMTGKSDLRLLNLVFGGAFQVDLANGSLGEVQYFAEDLLGRAPYFRLVAQSSNGDGVDTLVFPKLRLDGSVNMNLQREQVTNIELEAMAIYDYTYVCKDGRIGSAFEQLFGAKGETALHS